MAPKLCQVFLVLFLKEQLLIFSFVAYSYGTACHSYGMQLPVPASLCYSNCQLCGKGQDLSVWTLGLQRIGAVVESRVATVSRRMFQGSKWGKKLKPASFQR